MKIIRIFKQGNEHVIRLPAALRFTDEEVAVKHAGNGMLLLSLNDPWHIMQQALDEFEAGFKLARGQQC